MRGRFGRHAGLRAAAITAFGAAVAVAPMTLSAADPATAPQPWANVVEAVFVDLGIDGAPTGTPWQETLAQVSTSDPMSISVPVSGPVKQLGVGKNPPVVDGSVQFAFDASGTSDQKVRSDYTRSIPLKITPSYTWNGQPVAPEQLSTFGSAAGVIGVTYTIENTSSETTAVTFTGFDGGTQTQRVSGSIPFVADVIVTFPGTVTAIDAPGASLSPRPDGIHAKWTLLLAPPLGPASQTLSYTLAVPSPAVPKATVEAEALVVAMGPHEDELPAAPTDGGTSVGAGSGARLAASHADGVSRLGRAQATNRDAVVRADAELKALSAAQDSALQGAATAADRRAATVAAAAGAAFRSLSSQVATGAVQDAAQVDAAVTRVKARLDKLVVEATAHAAKAKVHLDRVKAVVKSASDLRTVTRALASKLGAHRDATHALRDAIAVAIVDLDAFPDHTLASWIKLSADLSAAQAQADAIVASADDAAERIGDLNARADDLRSKATAIATAAAGMNTRSGAIRRHLRDGLAASVRAMRTSVAALDAHVTGLESAIAARRASVSAATRRAGSTYDAREAQISASVAQKQRAARAAVHDAEAGLAQQLTDLDAEYAQLLGIQQIGLANALPGGNAVGTTHQTGLFVLTVAGT